MIIQLLILLPIAFLLRLLLRIWKNAQEARQWGCGSVPLYPSDILGLSTVSKMVEAGKGHTVPQMTAQQFMTTSNQEGRPVTTFRRREMGVESLVTADPKNIQAVLATQFKDFGHGAHRTKALVPLQGYNILTNEGEAWVRSRGLLRPQFAREQISDLDLEERHVQKAMQVIPVASDGWTGEVDIQTIFFRLTMDTATEFFIGKSVEGQLGALTGEETAETRFVFFLDRAKMFAAQRMRLPKPYWILTNRESRKAENEVNQYLDGHIQRAIETTQKEKHSASPGGPSRYVFLEALTAVTQDPIEIRSEILITIMAGTDTTASLLSWTVLLLARHPAEFQKLRQTVIDEFGSYKTRRNLTFTALKSCKQLQYCLNETLRLYPATPVNHRSATRNTTLPHGGGPDGFQPVFVPKGQMVIYSPHVLHRRKDIWGPDADEFNPSRWVDRKAGWEYIPFNGGPRICIGQQFALTEAAYVMVRLLQRFDAIEDVNAHKEVRQVSNLGNFPAESVTVRMHEAAD